MFYEFNTGLLTYLKFTSDLPNKFTEGTDLSIALSLKYKCQERYFFYKWKNAFHFSFKAFVLLSSSLSKFVFLLTNNTCTLLALKKKVIQSSSATEGITSSEPKQERAHNHCL